MQPCIACVPFSQQYEAYPKADIPVQLDAPLLYIHSSGSTGLPKTVPFKHELVVQNLRKSAFLLIFLLSDAHLS